MLSEILFVHNKNVTLKLVGPMTWQAGVGEGYTLPFPKPSSLPAEPVKKPLAP